MKVIVSALILASAGVLADSFQDSCEDLGIFSYVPDGEIRVGKNDFFIEGKCGLDKKTSLLFLDMCVANQDGKLVWRNRGSMSKTCSFCAMPADEDGRLYVQCTCKNVNGDVPADEAWEQQNRLYLDEVVIWENGGFNCLFD